MEAERTIFWGKFATAMELRRCVELENQANRATLCQLIKIRVSI